MYAATKSRNDHAKGGKGPKGSNMVVGSAEQREKKREICPHRLLLVSVIWICKQLHVNWSKSGIFTFISHSLTGMLSFFGKRNISVQVVKVCCTSGIMCCCSIRGGALQKSTHHHVILPARRGNKMLLTHCSHTAKLFSLMSDCASCVKHFTSFLCPLDGPRSAYLRLPLKLSATTSPGLLFAFCFFCTELSLFMRLFLLPGYSLVLLCCPSCWPHWLCSPRCHTEVFWLRSPPLPPAPCLTLTNRKGGYGVF